MHRARLVPLAALLACLALLREQLAAQPPVVEERLEVREIGVLAELPSDFAGATREELARRLRVAEDGVIREVTSVGRVGGTGTDAYSRVVVVVDLARCSAEILLTGAAAFGAHAESLTALGPVELASLGEEAVTRRFGPSRSSADTAEALATIAARERCGPPPAAERLERLALDAAALACAAPPCLLAWIGPGWGEPPPAGAGGREARPADAAAIEGLARTLASGGWSFLAAPISPAAERDSRQHVREPERSPGSDRYTFGINVLGARRDEPLTEKEYDRFVDLWLAPLRRLVAATAGEFVERAEQLPEALAAFSRRSIVYYRAERRPGSAPPRLELRAPEGRSYRAPDWAPGGEP